MGQATLPDHSELQQEARKEGYQRGDRLEAGGAPRFRYGAKNLYELSHVRMNSSDSTEAVPVTYKAGLYALVHVRTKPLPGQGEAHALSIAKITGIYEDDHRDCYVAVHYFWRWGQIHATYDLHDATRPYSRHQIFLQKEVLKNPMDINGEDLTTPVTYANGKPVELVSPLNLEGLTHVVHKSVAENYKGGLADFEDMYSQRPQHWEEETDTLVGGFWYDSKFDHSCYAFYQCDKYDKLLTDFMRIPRERLTMVDAFCGAGVVTVAANTVGISVAAGIDCDGEAISSWTGNTASRNGQPFNPNHEIEPIPFHMKVHDFNLQLEKLKSQQLLPKVAVLHASPPCQDVSAKKKEGRRIIDGSQAMAVVKMIELLKPAYVTLEEVPGFVAQSFLPENLRGVLAGWPNSNPQAAAAAAAAAAPEPAEDDVPDAEQDPAEDVADEVDDENAAAPAPGSIVFSNITILTSKLVGLGYSLELGLLQAVDYGVPQIRGRVILMATRRGYQPACLPTPRCVRPEPSHKSPAMRMMLSIDPNLCPREGPSGALVAAKWVHILETPPDSASDLFPHTTIAEAIGDLPALLARHQDGSASNRLGQLLVDLTRTAQGPVFRCPLPGGMLGGCEPHSVYSAYMKAPHTQQQKDRLRGALADGVLSDHMVEHSSEAIKKLLKPHDENGDSDPDRRKRPNLGLRTAAARPAACVMGHNEPRRSCLHFLEDRYHTILERRRLQSIPDWVIVLGKDKSRQQQIGNAVPYLLAVAVLGQVYAAATGEEPYRAPKLHGPSFDGVGIPTSEPESQQQFKQWVQQIEAAEQQQLPGKGYHGVLQQCRQLLEDKSVAIQLEQEEQQEQLRQQAVQHRLEQMQQTTTALQTQQSGQRYQQQSSAGRLSADQQQQLGAGRAASGGLSDPSSSGRRRASRLAAVAAAAGPGTSRQAELSNFSQQQARQQPSNGVPDARRASRSGGRAHGQQQSSSIACRDGTAQQAPVLMQDSRSQSRQGKKRGREEQGTQQQDQQQRKQARFDGTSAILAARGAAAEVPQAQAAAITAGDAADSRQQAKLRLQEVFAAS